MKKLSFSIGRSSICLALLLSATAIAQQNSSNSTARQKQSGASASSTVTQNETTNPHGGSPDSAVPGRVTGETPTQVQKALNKQLPAGHQVTASVADDGSLKLTGTVNSEADKKKAEEVARQVSNKNVINKIAIRSSIGNEPAAKPK